jgi:EAL domain-containing protein (putative c-di-GMP-specific phosphodiesterase class I)
MAALLEETTLSGIISAASEVADRLKFITGLEAILFDPDLKKRVKERSQLHKIIETKTWIFGEEYNLWVSDRSLTEILRHHRSKLDPTIVIDEPVKHVSQERGIVDLMLSRAQKKHRADDTEHLVIELKAPKAKLKAADLSQLEGCSVRCGRPSIPDCSRPAMAFLASV